MNYNYIIDPVSNNKLNIHSKKAINILKKYIRSYQQGGEYINYRLAPEPFIKQAFTSLEMYHLNKKEDLITKINYFSQREELDDMIILSNKNNLYVKSHKYHADLLEDRFKNFKDFWKGKKSEKALDFLLHEMTKIGIENINFFGDSVFLYEDKHNVTIAKNINLFALVEEEKKDKFYYFKYENILNNFLDKSITKLEEILNDNMNLSYLTFTYLNIDISVSNKKEWEFMFDGVKNTMIDTKTLRNLLEFIDYLIVQKSENLEYLTNKHFNAKSPKINRSRSIGKENKRSTQVRRSRSAKPRKGKGRKQKQKQRTKKKTKKIMD